MAISTTLAKTALAAGVSSLLMLGSAIEAKALTFVNSSAGLGANDSVDWATLAPDRATVSNPFSTTSTNGIGVTGSMPSNSFIRGEQSRSIFGNFLRGEAVLWTHYNSGPLSLVFSSPVRGVGAQIQSEYYGSFVGTIEAFNASNVSLGSFSLPGNSTNAGNGSAIFLGLLSSSNEISRVNFNTYRQNAPTQGFGINQLLLATSPTAAVPTPALLPGLIGMGVAAYRKRKATVAKI